MRIPKLDAHHTASSSRRTSNRGPAKGRQSRILQMNGITKHKNRIRRAVRTMKPVLFFGFPPLLSGGMYFPLRLSR